VLSLSKITARLLIRAFALLLAYGLVAFRDAGPLALLRAVEAIGPYVLLFVVTGAAIDMTQKHWRKSWRFTSLSDIIVMARNSTVTVLVLLAAVFVFDRAAALPRSALFLTWVLDVLAFAGLLTLRRAMHERALGSALAPFLGKPGGGEAKGRVDRRHGRRRRVSARTGAHAQSAPPGDRTDHAEPRRP
jgi:FlaA1/EpsC-like NDP-sugar epimerase